MQANASRENIQELAEKNIDFVGSLADNAAKARTNQPRFAATQFVYEAEQDRYICPAGKPLLYEGRDERGGISYLKYKAAAEDCKNCSLRAACCGGNQKHSRSIVRSQESPVMNAFREKMATGQAQAVYHCCSDCYRVERTSSRAGLTPACGPSPFHGAPDFPTSQDLALIAL